MDKYGVRYAEISVVWVLSRQVGTINIIVFILVKQGCDCG